jgi:hypothetical protein
MMGGSLDMRHWTVLGLALFPAAAFAQPPVARPNPAVKAIVEEISEERIAAILKKLESFGTRHVMSDQKDPEHGIGAAQRWIFEQLQSYSPRLQVRYETFTLHKGAGRGAVLHDVELANVVAVLPGEVDKDCQILVSGHYDSLDIAHAPARTDEDRLADFLKDGATEADARAYMKLFPLSEARGRIDNDATARQKFAPGVTDDGSGTAAVMELARVMSRHKFDKTLVFVAFTGEEIGLEGAKAYVARHSGEQIEALLNNDIIGSDVAGNGLSASGVLRVFSAGPEDSPARALARYTKDIAEQYVPSMKVDLIFRRDRFMRGGDHTPFADAGIAAVRLTTPSENYENQHTPTDTFANTSVPYTTRVVRMNAAVLASLALAPRPPVVAFTWGSGKLKGSRVPLLSRGKSGYDAVLRWMPSPEADVAGYSILLRRTTSPVWQREIYAGNVTSYTLPDFSIDDVVIGIKAIDRDGNPSLVSAYDLPAVRRETRTTKAPPGGEKAEEGSAP